MRLPDIARDEDGLPVVPAIEERVARIVSAVATVFFALVATWEIAGHWYEPLLGKPPKQATRMEIARVRHAVQAKIAASVDKLIPVNVPPTEEFATMLSSRLRILSGTVLDEIRATTAGHARTPGHRSGKASMVQTHRWRGPGRGAASS